MVLHCPFLCLSCGMAMNLSIQISAYLKILVLQFVVHVPSFARRQCQCLLAVALYLIDK